MLTMQKNLTLEGVLTSKDISKVSLRASWWAFPSNTSLDIQEEFIGTLNTEFTIFIFRPDQSIMMLLWPQSYIEYFTHYYRMQLSLDQVNILPTELWLP